MHIYPSLIAAPLLRLESVIHELDPFVDGYHLDIMDDHFVPNMTWGADFVHAIAQATGKRLWVHCMVDNPDVWISRLMLPPDSIISFHIELNVDFSRIILRIKEKKWRASIVINPKTAPEKIFPYLELCDQVLIMSVEPGFSGQAFLPKTVQKAAMLHQYKQEHQLQYTLGMDGGIGIENIADICMHGVTDIAAAKAIFGQSDYIRAVQKLRQVCGQVRK